MERAIGLGGVAALLGIAWLASTNRRAVAWRTVGVALALQLAIALLALRSPVAGRFFQLASDVFTAFLGFADHGIEFVFGRWPERVMGAEGEPVRLPFVFAVRVLPLIIFASSLSSVLYHLGVLQWVVGALARGLRRLLRVSGAESLAVIGEIFLGMTEAPLLVRPYIETLTRSELFTLMTAGLASVAGSVLAAYVGLLGPEFAGHLIAASFMSAPAAIAIAKIVVPEQGHPLTLGGASIPLERHSRNVVDAAALGASEGLRLALNVGAMLIAFVALVHLLDGALGGIGRLVGLESLTLGHLLGLALAPLAFLMGVPAGDALAVGEMLGVKTVLNELLAYQMLADARGALEPRSAVIASYALCGFANLGSLAILLGGLGGIAPSRRADIASDGFRAILAGSLASFLSGAVAGLLL